MPYRDAKGKILSEQIMKNKLLSIFFLLLLSCSPNELAQDDMEMLWMDLNRPEVYNWFDASNPGTSWIEFECGSGPYQVSISGKQISVQTDKPISRALHLTGKYGRDAIEIPLQDPDRFKLTITDPDPYGEVIRIFF